MSADSDNSKDATRRALKAHEFYVYDLALNCRQTPIEIDIITRLRNSTSYIVDNNIPWKALAPAHPSVNFILGCTICEEAENLEGVLFSRLPAGGYPNVFSVELLARDNQRVVFHRVDEHYQQACFAHSIPPLSNTSPEHRADQILAADSFRQQLAPLLVRPQTELAVILAGHRANSLGDFGQAGCAAAVATAIHLQQLSPSLRDRKLKPGYRQLPGDSRLIFEALFYGCSILSTDAADVHALGQICGVTVRPRP